MTSTATPVSAAPEQEHYHNHNQEQFHGISPLVPTALFAAYLSIQRPLQCIVPDKRAARQLALRGLSNFAQSLSFAARTASVLVGEIWVYPDEEQVRARRNLLSRSELHPNAMEEQMTRHPISVEENKKPLKPEADDQSHVPAKHIEETGRLASSVETAKDPGKVRRIKD